MQICFNSFLNPLQLHSTRTNTTTGEENIFQIPTYCLQQYYIYFSPLLQAIGKIEASLFQICITNIFIHSIEKKIFFRFTSCLMVNKTPKKGLILTKIRFLLPDTRILVTGIPNPVDILREKKFTFLKILHSKLMTKKEKS